MSAYAITEAGIGWNLIPPVSEIEEQIRTIITKHGGTIYEIDVENNKLDFDCGGSYKIMQCLIELNEIMEIQ
jgi:hypothetical protein